MIRACLFDLDGTLLNTALTITYFLNLALSRSGISPITVQEAKRFVGDGARVLVERALASKAIADSDLCKRVLSVYRRAYDDDPYRLTAPYDGMRETLFALRARGVALGVISNKPDQTAKAVVSRFFPELFGCVLGAREDLPLKPDPRGARALCAALSVDPAQTLYFGDTGVDMQTGRALGAGRTVGVLWGFRDREELQMHRAQALISHPSEILDLPDIFPHSKEKHA